MVEREIYVLSWFCGSMGSENGVYQSQPFACRHDPLGAKARCQGGVIHCGGNRDGPCAYYTAFISYHHTGVKEDGLVVLVSEPKGSVICGVVVG